MGKFFVRVCFFFELFNVSGLTAEEMFLKISQAFELLSDPAAREAYDQLQAAKTAKAVYLEKRRQTESAQRAKFREELERREANAANSQEEAKVAERNFEKEVVFSDLYMQTWVIFNID